MNFQLERNAELQKHVILLENSDPFSVKRGDFSRDKGSFVSVAIEAANSSRNLHARFLDEVA